MRVFFFLVFQVFGIKHYLRQLFEGAQSFLLAGRFDLRRDISICIFKILTNPAFFHNGKI